MNDLELGKVVARIQAGDHRHVDKVVIAHWREMIGDLEFEDAYAAAVEHFRESNEYLRPAHIRSIVRRRRRDAAVREETRLMLEDRPAGEVVPMPEGLRREIRDDKRRAKARKAMLNGVTPARAIPQADPEYQKRLADAKAELDARRSAGEAQQ